LRPQSAPSFLSYRLDAAPSLELARSARSPPGRAEAPTRPRALLIVGGGAQEGSLDFTNPSGLSLTFEPSGFRVRDRPGLILYQEGIQFQNQGVYLGTSVASVPGPIAGAGLPGLIFAGGGLVNDWGRPFSDAGFGNWFRDRCVEAGVLGRAHGLRKAGATIAANNGATSRQLMAIFGWDTLKEAERYTRGADQLRLAEAAMHMLEAPEQNGTVSCPTEGPGGTFLEKE